MSSSRVVYEILISDENICIVVERGNNEFRPYVMRNCELFNPRTGFRPVKPRYKQRALNPELIPKANEMIAQANEVWESIKKQSAQEPQKHDVERPNEGSSGDAANMEAKERERVPQPSYTLEKLIAKSVAELSVSEVMKVARPFIDKYIADTYGMIPKVIEVKSESGTRRVGGITHEKFSTILSLVNLNIPVFLSGPAGCGKNVICKQVADSLGIDFYFTNAVTQEYKLTGFIDANGRYHETQFYKAFVNGGVFMLDEIDASSPEVLVILNAAIANKYFDFPTGRISAHENFRVVAAGNTFGTGADVEYTGRFQLDASSLDRFAIVEVSYDKAIEQAISGGDKELVEFVGLLRSSIKKSGLKFIVSYRAIERLRKLKGVLDVKEAIKTSVIQGMSSDDVKLIARNITSSSKNEYVEALKSI
jgi:cobaltochelatase CobS|nr:MAG TPA: ATPase-like protein [Caudoviricetes sp.]